jgi:hypothetical protein
VFPLFVLKSFVWLQKTPSKPNCLFAFHLQGALPNPIMLLEEFDLFLLNALPFMCCAHFSLVFHLLSLASKPLILAAKMLPSSFCA